MKSASFYKAENYFLRRPLFVAAIYFQLVSFTSCHKNEPAAGSALLFDSVPSRVALNPMVSEISGIADSKANAGYVWGQEDSGNPPQLYIINHNGAVLKTVYIKGATNRDWEDMAVSGTDIYIAETGDNNLSFADYGFYKFREPSSATDTVQGFDMIRFKYPDGSHDAEAFLVDPSTKDIYIITKRDMPSKIYKLAYPYSLTSLNTAMAVGSLTYSGVVSAAISADGKEILIKTYPGIFYYKRSAGETIDQALQKNYTALPYRLEPMGEALSFATDNKGFYTLSEKGFGSSVNLFFYKRK